MHSTKSSQSSVVFIPVGATVCPTLQTTASTAVMFDGRISTFAAGTDTLSTLLSSDSQCRSIDAGLVATSEQHSTPLKPAKRYRGTDDDDRKILRSKRNLTLSLTSAASRYHDSGQQQQQQQQPTSSLPGALSESVERRNLRERRRVKLINVTFATLRNRLPSYCWQHRQHHHQQQRQQRRERRRRDAGSSTVNCRRRPSKVDTLRTTIEYIRGLQDLLADDDRRRLSKSQTMTCTVIDQHQQLHSRTTSSVYDSISPPTSASSWSSECLTMMSAASVAATLMPPTCTDDSQNFADVSLLPISDILDWL